MSQATTSPSSTTSTRGLQASTPASGREVSASKGWWKTFNHLLRRIHLYAGLLLLPWVFLYGVTGLLFNHHNLFADVKTLHFDRGDMEGTALAEAPTAAQIAEQVVATINARQKSNFRLVEPSAARFERGGLSANVTDASGAAYTVSLDASGNGGTIRPARDAAANAEPAPFAAKRGVEVEGLPLTQVEEALPDVLAKAGLAEPKVSEVRMAPISFQMEEDGQRWQVNYNAQNGSLSGLPLTPDNMPKLSARQFLLRLHLVHHYPSEFGVRWIWAVIVDVISILMVFWGVSGIVMWLQIKRTRALGALCLSAGVVAVVWMGYGMYALFLAGGR